MVILEQAGQLRAAQLLEKDAGFPVHVRCMQARHDRGGRVSRSHPLQQHPLLRKIKGRIEHFEEPGPVLLFYRGLLVGLPDQDIQVAAFHRGLHGKTAHFIVEARVQGLHAYHFITGGDGEVDDIPKAAGETHMGIHFTAALVLGDEELVADQAGHGDQQVVAGDLDHVRELKLIGIVQLLLAPAPAVGVQDELAVGTDIIIFVLHRVLHVFQLAGLVFLLAFAEFFFITLQCRALHAGPHIILAAITAVVIIQRRGMDQRLHIVEFLAQPRYRLLVGHDHIPGGRIHTGGDGIGGQVLLWLAGRKGNGRGRGILAKGNDIGGGVQVLLPEIKGVGEDRGVEDELVLHLHHPLRLGAEDDILRFGDIVGTGHHQLVRDLLQVKALGKTGSK